MDYEDTGNHLTEFYQFLWVGNHIMGELNGWSP